MANCDQYKSTSHKKGENMLNPCRPCVCPKTPCEQCMFGYRPAEENHETMKKLIMVFNAGETPLGYKCAERYMLFHENWENEIEKGEQTMNYTTAIYGSYGIVTNEVKPTPEDRPYDNYHMLEIVRPCINLSVISLNYFVELF